MDDDEFAAFLAGWTGDEEEARQWLNRTAELFPDIPDLEFIPQPKKKQKETVFRPQTPETTEGAFGIGEDEEQQKDSGEDDKFRPLRPFGSESSSIPRPVWGIAAEAAVRSRDEDELIRAADNLSKEALDQEQQLALQQREEEREGYVPSRLILPDFHIPEQYEGVNENYEEQDDEAPQVAAGPARISNKEGPKYGTKRGRAFQTDPCGFRTYEDYVSFCEGKKYRKSVIWDEDEWNIYCHPNSTRAVIAKALQPAQPAKEYKTSGRIPDYVKIRTFAAFHAKKKGRNLDGIKNQAQLDAKRKEWKKQNPNWTTPPPSPPASDDDDDE